MSQNKTCLHCSTSFDITQSDLDFYNKASPTFAGEKFQIPTPNCCPDCRQQRRLSFRNERNLYRRTCDASGKQIISMYSPDCGYKIYDQKIWQSDAWNPMDYGRDFDFSRSFTENLKELSLLVPRPSMYNLFADNSDYCNCTSYQKDCYLTSASTGNEKCMYSAYTNNSTHCIDNFMTFDCENCYMTIDCEKSYKLIYASNCRNCSESYFLSNCNDCSFCWNCDGLDNKKYCIDNIQYEKEEYNQKIEEFKKSSWSQKLDMWKSKKQQNTILFSTRSTGHHIRNSKNAENCVDAGSLEDCKNCTWFFWF